MGCFKDGPGGLIVVKDGGATMAAGDDGREVDPAWSLVANPNRLALAADAAAALGVATRCLAAIDPNVPADIIASLNCI